MRKHTTATEFDVRNLDSLPRVDIVVSYVGADGTMIEAAAKAGAKGHRQRRHRRRTADTGGRRRLRQMLQRDRHAHVPFSRVASGRVVEARATKARLRRRRNLQPWKARLLLSLALTKTNNADEIQRMFDTY